MYPSWQSSREQVSEYFRRNPWDCPLYRLVYHYRDEFEYNYEFLFEQKYGFLRSEVLEAFTRFLNCGVLRHGAARAYCTNCNHSILIAFSCKRRGLCPSCQAKRAVLYAEHLHENVLLRESHRHLIFSLPKRLRIYFRYERSLFQVLYRAAWESWNEYVSDNLRDAGRTGAVMALHSAGELLHWHPHIHAIALNGLVPEDGSFSELPALDTNVLEQSFSEKVFSALLDRGLISDEIVESMKSWKHSGFNVYSAEPIGAEDERARLFLGRYLKKSPVAANRLSIDESDSEPVVVYRKLSDEGEETRTFSPLEFLAELSLHIPKVFEQTSRMYGCYSSSTRGKLARVARFERWRLGRDATSEESENNKQAASASFARCMKMVFEIDPLKCRKCGHQMKIVAFVFNSREIEKLADNLGLVTWRAPPPIKASFTEIDFSSQFAQ